MRSILHYMGVKIKHQYTGTSFQSHIDKIFSPSKILIKTKVKIQIQNT